MDALESSELSTSSAPKNIQMQNTEFSTDEKEDYSNSSQFLSDFSENFGKKQGMKRKCERKTIPSTNMCLNQDLNEEFTSNSPKREKVNTKTSEFIQFNQNSEKINEIRVNLLTSQLKSSEKKVSQLQIENKQQENKISEQQEVILAQNSEIEELEGKIESLNNELAKSKKKNKTTRLRIAALEDVMSKKDTELVNLQTALKELQLNQRELEESLKQEQEKKKEDKELSDKEENENEAAEAIESMEDLINSQSEEIQNLSMQRTQIVNSFAKFSKIIEDVEEKLKRVQKENEKLKEEMQRNEEKAAEEKQINDDKWKQCVSKLKELLPKDSPEFDLESESKEEILEKFVLFLLKQNSTIKDNEESCDTDFEYLKRRHIETISQLAGAVDLIKKFANSNAENKETTLNQCAKIQCFIDSGNQDFLKENCPALFSQTGRMEASEVANLFYNIVGDNINDSPFAELNLLLTGVLQINKVLFEHQEQITNEFNDKKDRIRTELQKENQTKIDSLQEEHSFIVTNLQKFLKSDEEEVETLFNKFIANIKDDLASNQEEQNEIVEKLSKEIENLKEELEETKSNNDKERQEFCDKASKIVTTIEKHYNEQLKENEEMIAKMNDDIKEKQENIENVLIKTNSNDEEAKRIIEEKSSKISELECENNFLKQELEKAKTKVSEINEKLTETTSELNGNILQLNETVTKLTEDLEHQKQKHKFYKSRLEEVKQSTEQTLEEVRKRSSSLSDKYDETIARLEENVAALRNENEELNNKVNDFTPYKRELETKNARLQISERTTKLKLRATNDALIRMKEEFEDRKNVLAEKIKQKDAMKIHEIEQKVEKANSFLISVLKEEFDTDAKESNIEDNIEQLKDKYRSRNATTERIIYNDALYLRNQLKMKEDGSLTDTFKEIVQHAKAVNDEREKSKHNEKKALQKLAQVENENSKLNDAIVENREWDRWSKLMYTQLSGSNKMKSSTKETKQALEEGILSINKEKTLLRKLDILRFEKTVLSKNPRLFKRSNDIGKVTSCRPLMVAFIFMQRMKSFGQESNQTKTTKKRRNPILPM